MNQIASRLAHFFELERRGSSFATEARGALATFLTMAYILFANPTILEAAGIPRDAALASTAAAAGVCCLLMGFFANFPLALASGMGLNAVVAFQIAPAAGGWQVAMGLVVLNGLAVLLLVLLGVREAVMAAIPADLRRAIGAGIGLFIAFIGLVNAQIVIPGPAGGPPVAHGSLQNPATLVAVSGLLLTAALLARRVKGAMVLGILFGTGLGLALHLTRLPSGFSAPSFALLGKADVLGALQWKFLPFLFGLMMVDFFDTLGSVTAIAEQAGLHDEEGRIPRLRSLLMVDAVSAAVGGLFGASSVTSYIESAAGVGEGARTGLHSVLVGLLFLVSILAAPLAGLVPSAATAPALIVVGFLMISQLTRINFRDPETGIPAFITLVTLPLTYSIAHGIGYGFVAYVGIKVLIGKPREVHPLLYGVSAAFLAYFVWGRG